MRRCRRPAIPRGPGQHQGCWLLTETTSQYEKLAVLTVITFVLLFVISVAVVFGNRGQTGRVLPGAGAMAGERA